jgi:anti-sigma regulatory factor (Ser/Thr protein kinase)
LNTLVDAIMGRRVTLGRVVTLRLAARNDIRVVEQVVREVMRFLDDQARPSDDWQLRFALCLRETVYNAVMHGNQNRRDAAVDIEAQWHPAARRAVLIVRDGGRGFDWKAALESERTQDPDRVRGRGLVILAEMTEQVDVDSGEVRFTLSLPPPADGPA